jgi:hypothetical protein
MLTVLAYGGLVLLVCLAIHYAWRLLWFIIDAIMYGIGFVVGLLLVIWKEVYYMKFTVNIPYIEKVGHGVKHVATAPKRKADEHLKAVMAQALMEVANTMQANIEKEQA